MRKSIRHARLFLPHVRKSRDFYLDFLDLISVGLAALAQLTQTIFSDFGCLCTFRVLSLAIREDFTGDFFLFTKILNFAGIMISENYEFA